MDEQTTTLADDEILSVGDEDFAPVTDDADSEDADTTDESDVDADDTDADADDTDSDEL